MTSDLLQEFIRLVEKLHLLPSNHGPALLRQLADYILFNPALWCRAPPKVQIELQKFLATEFISSKLIQSSLRRVSTTLIFLHALKYYYWLVDPGDRSNIQVRLGRNFHFRATTCTPCINFLQKSLASPKNRPKDVELLSLRAYLLLFLKQLMQQPKFAQSSQEVYCPEEELNALTNFLLTVHEDQNILDVLQLLVTLAIENPLGVAGTLADSRGTAAVYKLLNSTSEEVRINAIKLLTIILENANVNKKKEIMEEAGLWALLTDRYG